MFDSTIPTQAESVQMVSCRLCSSSAVKLRYSEAWKGIDYRGYYCDKCDLYQTLGEIAAVSPEYQALAKNDLTPVHVALQTGHKATAFSQWAALMERHTHRPLAGNLLDIGCGIGGFLDEAKTRGLRAYGFDASSAQADSARLRHPNVANLISLDEYAKTLPIPTTFDYITMWDVLEHIREPADLLDSARRHLTPGGHLFVSVPGGGAIPIKLAFTRLLGRPPGLTPWEHVFYYTRRSLSKLMHECGFELVEVGGVVPYPRPMSFHEATRRVAFGALRQTNLALQVFAVAK